MDWTGNTAGEMGSAYRILIENPDEKEPHDRHRRDREYNNK
jgi:hypothetical protein